MEIVVLEGNGDHPNGGNWKCLPLEIWEMVLLQLETSEDVQNVCSVMPELEDLVMGKQHVLFMDRVFPLICTSLSKADTLACRRVCKRWRAAVDQLLQTPKRRFTFSCTFPMRREVMPEDRLEEWRRLTNQAPKSADLKQFFNTIHFGRTCTVTYNSRTENNKHFLCFFRKMGHKISNLNLEIKCEDVETMISVLKDVLALCPNLSSLDLLQSSFHRCSYFHPVTDQNRFEYAEQWKDLLRPVWPKELKYLSIELEDIFKCPQIIKHVCLSLCSEKFERFYDFGLGRTVQFLHGTGSITKLKIVQVTCENQLRQMLNLDLSLTYLHLDLSIIPLYLSNLNDLIKLLISVIQMFKPTLRTLELYCSFPTDNTAIRSNLPVLDLPNLKSLSLWGYPSGSLNAFSNLRSLEYFLIREHREYYQMKPEQLAAEVLDIRGLNLRQPYNKPKPFHRLHFSNVWTVFRKLREFSFGNYVAKDYQVRRDDAEKHKEHCDVEHCKFKIK